MIETVKYIDEDDDDTHRDDIDHGTKYDSLTNRHRHQSTVRFFCNQRKHDQLLPRNATVKRGTCYLNSLCLSIGKTAVLRLTDTDIDTLAERKNGCTVHRSRGFCTKATFGQ